jgi:PadR family transcriptional regulator, regulatory protein PadR
MDVFRNAIAVQRGSEYYRLTAAGRKQLAAETVHWSRMTSAIARILEPA